MNNIKKTILDNYEVVYNLLYISKYKVLGRPYIQVHCNKYNLEYSKLFNLSEIDDAVFEFLRLRRKYDFVSNNRNG